MAITLTTSYQAIGSSVKFTGESSYYYYVFAKYAKASATTANIYLCFRTFGTGDESCSCSGATMSYTLNGTTKTAGSGGFSVYKRQFSGDIATVSFTVTYGSDGKWANKSVSCSASGGNGTYSGGGTIGNNGCGTVSNITDTLTLPAIDPVPSCSISSISVTNGYNGNAVSSISSLTASMTFKYAKTATLTVTGAGVTKSYTISVTKASSETKTQVVPLTDFASTSNFTMSFSLTASNDTGSGSATSTKAVKGYFLPTYGSATYTRRCDSSGNADSQGEYGRLYLTWSVATVDTSNPNTLQTCTVKLNGTTISATSGSISAGYLDFIFPLAVNVQGNMTVYFADKIYNNTITSLVVPKSIMPLSLYQSGDTVGVSVGRMATSSGFWCYEEFYLKQSGGTKIFNVAINGSGNMTITDVSGTLSMNYISGDTI